MPDTLSITGFSPISGVTGTTVTINGTGFTNASAVTFAGNNAASFTVISSTQIQATVPNVSPTTGTICITNSKGCVVCSTPAFAITTGVTLNVKLYIEGFYLSLGQMKAVANPISNPTICDTIIVRLHQAVSPYSEI